MDELIDFINAVGKLKHIKRTGWVREGVPDSESVADHTFRTILICYLLADKLRVDANKLIRMALIHDLAEIEAGDIVMRRGTKIVHSPQDKFDKEKNVLTQLLSKIKNGRDYLELWLEYEEQKTKEALILKQIDKLEMVFQALEYEKEVEPSKLNEFWDDARTTLKEPFLVKIFNELEKRRKK